MRTKARRSALAGVGAAIVAMALIGMAHAPFARSLLMSFGGCPMAGARMTPAVAERARQMALAVDTATMSAPFRPALGFALDSTTIEETRAWAHREHVDCEEARFGLIHCAGVRPEALGVAATQGQVDDLALEFDPRGRLVNMTTLRTHLRPAVAATEAHAIVESLVSTLGPATKGAGDFEASSLGGPAAESISTVRYRFADYVADVTAMNAPSSGASIREHYMSAKD